MITNEDDLRAAEEAEERAAQAAAKSLAATMAKAHGVRAFPQAAQRLLEVVRDARFRVDEIAETIESDTSLAARVLRVVNSPVFGLRVQIRKIRLAVTLLGVKNLTEIATAAAFLDWFEDEAPGVSEIFRHSSAVAALAQRIAPRCGLSPEEMYSCGLLHDFGKLILIQSGDEDYAQLALAFTHEPDVMHIKEREAYGFDHAVLAAYMFAEWKIPEPLPRVIALHHQPERAFRRGDNVGRMVAALRWAERLVHEFDENRVIDDAWIDEMSRDECVLHLDFARADFGKFCRDLQQTYRDTLKITSPEAPGEAAVAPEAPGPTMVDVSDWFACRVCGVAAFDVVCPRCDVPLCPTHAPKDGGPCPACSTLPPLEDAATPLEPFWRPAMLALSVGALSLAFLSAGVATLLVPRGGGPAAMSPWWTYLPLGIGPIVVAAIVRARAVERTRSTPG